ncbi:efflux RND transporter periplasmic adaptor subunit [Desulforhopalus singaporensis]|uniref:RND family efflux transporter, MFP subunit n=1 Tax=Desulforhopalus singaporensis TaxID=91360 RepID=A0A1H0JXX7_9BACT|nr:efflux RND transporter periplasmic adaptor subunit [Desulforhopalus singaporensis]SDO48605.1 RND family efflux transporter, MFP subunit [Desulforhopalus singaporensis]
MPTPQQSKQPANPQGKKKLSTAAQAVAVFLIIGGALLVGRHYTASPPKVATGNVVKRVQAVTAEAVEVASGHFTIEAMGTIIAAQKIDLLSKVAGDIVRVSDEFTTGGSFHRGDMVIDLDQEDFNLTLRQLQSEVIKAQSDYQLELGNQRISRKEYEILGEQVSPEEQELMLRRPQLAIAEANLMAARAKLDQAQLNLVRTRITAPFNCVVLSKNVDVGSRISQATALAQLAGTDVFHLELTIPTGQLERVALPDRNDGVGSSIRVFIQQKNEAGKWRTGRIIGLAPGLEPKGRMAVVIGEVADPLSLLPENKDKTRLLLNSYVRAEIDGKEFSGLPQISRAYLRDNNTVWLLTGDGKLEIREVKTAGLNRDKIIVSKGLSGGELLITSDINRPIDGMALKPVRTEKTPQIQGPTPDSGVSATTQPQQ